MTTPPNSYSFTVPDEYKDKIIPQFSQNGSNHPDNKTDPQNNPSSNPKNGPNFEHFQDQQLQPPNQTPQNPCNPSKFTPHPANPQLYHTTAPSLHIATSRDYSNTLPGVNLPNFDHRNHISHPFLNQNNHNSDPKNNTAYPQTRSEPMNANFPFIPASHDPTIRISTEFLTREYQKWDTFRIFQTILFTYIECFSSNTNQKKVFRISRFPTSLYDLQIEVVNEMVLLGFLTQATPGSIHIKSPKNTTYQNENPQFDLHSPRNRTKSPQSHVFSFRGDDNQPQMLKFPKLRSNNDPNPSPTHSNHPQTPQQTQNIPNSSISRQNTPSTLHTPVQMTQTPPPPNPNSTLLPHNTHTSHILQSHHSDPSLPTLQFIAAGVGLLGFIRFELGYYLQLIISSIFVGKVGSHDIHSIESVKLIQLYSNDCVFACDVATNVSTLPNFLMPGKGVIDGSKKGLFPTNFGKNDDHTNSTPSNLANNVSNNASTRDLFSPSIGASGGMTMMGGGLDKGKEVQNLLSSIILPSVHDLDPNFDFTATGNVNYTTNVIDPVIGDWVYSGLKNEQKNLIFKFYHKNNDLFAKKKLIQDGKIDHKNNNDKNSNQNNAEKSPQYHLEDSNSMSSYQLYHNQSNSNNYSTRDGNSTSFGPFFYLQNNSTNFDFCDQKNEFFNIALKIPFIPHPTSGFFTGTTLTTTPNQH